MLVMACLTENNAAHAHACRAPEALPQTPLQLSEDIYRLLRRAVVGAYIACVFVVDTFYAVSHLADKVKGFILLSYIASPVSDHVRPLA